MSRIKLVVVDDHSLFRRGLVGLLEEMTEFQVVGEASNGQDALGVIENAKPDIVLLDINMAEVDGSTLFEVMKVFHKNIKVVVASVYSINEQKERIKDADGYFDKSDDKEVLVTIVSSILC